MKIQYLKNLCFKIDGIVWKLVYVLFTTAKYIALK